MQKMKGKDENPFEGISTEVRDFVFEDAEFYKRWNPWLEPNDRRLDFIITKVAILDLALSTKRNERPTVQQVLKLGIADWAKMCARDYKGAEELLQYADDDWNRLLRVAEQYFYAFLFQLRETECEDIHGWIRPGTDELEEVISYFGLEKETKP